MSIDAFFDGLDKEAKVFALMIVCVFLLVLVAILRHGGPDTHTPLEACAAACTKGVNNRDGRMESYTHALEATTTCNRVPEKCVCTRSTP